MTAFQLFSCGSNSHGQLGTSNDVDSSLYISVLIDNSADLPGRVQSIVFGGTHTLLLCCVIRQGRVTNELYVAGNDERGQLGGISTVDDVEERKVLSFRKLSLEMILDGLAKEDLNQLDKPETYEIQGIAASWDTSFIHLRSERSRERRNDVLLSMGGNDWNELGTVSTSTSSVQLISFDHLIPSNLLSTAKIRINDIKAGPRHIIAKIEIIHSASEHHLVGWGASRHGQLGNSSPGILKSPRTTEIPTLLQPPINQNDKDILQIGIGRDHTLLLYNLTTIILLGSSRQNQLGPFNNNGVGILDRSSNLGETIKAGESSSLEQIGSSWTSNYILKRNELNQHQLYGFGSNAHCQLGTQSTLTSSPTPLLITLPVPPSSQVIQLACGSEHVLVLVANVTGDTEVISWGWNEHGNIGNGSKVNVEEPVQVWPNSSQGLSSRVVDVWAGNATSWIQIEIDPLM
jgi:protein ATS1